MASKTFAIRTEPHVATVGTTDLFFQPEVVGAEFAEGYDKLREVQKKYAPVKSSSTKHAKDVEMDSHALAEVAAATREFLNDLMLPESQVAFRDMRIPDRVLYELMEWVGELYGGGSGNPADAGGTSTD